MITIFLTLGFSISLQSLLAAWTAPSSNPPTNNIADLNLGGGLSVAKNTLIMGNLLVASTTNALYANSVTGNVGIGTKTPMAKLDVVGDILVNNVTIGKGGGSFNTNTAVGEYALKSNTTGSGNTANGSAALSFNTSGSNNTANGGQALRNNTTGIYNTANGVLALRENISGRNNTANGVVALGRNTSGSQNTANGVFSLYNNNGNYNTANGYYSLYSNAAGSNNTANGYYSLLYNTNGSYNTANGTYALYSTTGSFNTAIGQAAGYLNTTGSNNIAMGYGANLPSNTGSNQVRIGNTAITYAGIQVPWTTTSDRRLKDDIQNVPLGIDFIKELRPVDYFRKNDAGKKRETGLIAQEVDEVLEKFGYKSAGMIAKDDNGYYSLRYNDFVAPIIKSIQEISTTTDSMLERIKKLENENDSLVKLVCLDHPTAKICQ